jgi:hypothetical protein
MTGLITSYAVGTVGVVGLVVAWVAVQSAWRRVFPDASAEPDVLARRRSCRDCGSSDRCTRSVASGELPVEEGIR